MTKWPRSRHGLVATLRANEGQTRLHEELSGAYLGLVLGGRYMATG